MIFFKHLFSIHKFHTDEKSGFEWSSFNPPLATLVIILLPIIIGNWQCPYALLFYCNYKIGKSLWAVCILKSKNVSWKIPIKKLQKASTQGGYARKNNDTIDLVPHSGPWIYVLYFIFDSSLFILSSTNACGVRWIINPLSIQISAFFFF